MESNSETFYTLPGSGRKLQVPVKGKKNRGQQSPSGVQNFDYGGFPEDEPSDLRYNPSYISEEGEETVLLEEDEDEEEAKARRIRREMEDEATHFTEGLGEETLLQEDSDDEEVNALAEELDGILDEVNNDKSDDEDVEKAALKDSSMEQESVIDVSHDEVSLFKEVSKYDSETLNENEDAATSEGNADRPEIDEAKGTVAAEAANYNVFVKSEVDCAKSETEVEDDVATGKVNSGSNKTGSKPYEAVVDARNRNGDEGKQVESDTAGLKSEEGKVDPEGNSLNTTTTGVLTDDQENEETDEIEEAGSEVEVAKELDSSVGAPDEKQDGDSQKISVDPPAEDGMAETDVEGKSTNSAVVGQADDNSALVFAPAVDEGDGNVTASDTDFVTDSEYYTTEYPSDTDYGGTDASSFDYDTDATDITDMGDGGSVTHSVANSIAVNGRGPKSSMNQKERSKWSLFGCGIVEEIPSTKREWWNYVLDSTEGALQDIGGQHWDDPWHEDDEEFDDGIDDFLNKNLPAANNRRRRRPRSTGRPVSAKRKNASRRKYSTKRRSASAPRFGANNRSDRRKRLV